MGNIIKKIFHFIKSIFQKEEVNTFLKEIFWEFLISIGKVAKRNYGNKEEAK